MEHLDRDAPIVFAISREVNRRHAARAKPALDAIPVREGGCESVWVIATRAARRAPGVQPLQERVEDHCANGRCLIPHADIEFFREDSNAIVNAIMRRIPVRAYTFVFADIERPNQLPFDTVRALKMHGHESVDFCVLFPDDMALRRMLPYDREALQPNVDALNRFYGTERWMELWEQRTTDAQSPLLYHRLQQLYRHQLGQLKWKRVVEVRYVRRTGQAGLYKLLLASNHDAASRLATWSATKESRRLFGPDLFD